MTHLRLCAAAIIASVSSPAVAQSLPDGWGPYRFGMTVDQVQAIPGISWDKLEVIQDTDPFNPGPDTYHLTSLAPVAVNGRPAQFTVLFNATKQVNEFHFERQVPGKDCEAAFQRDLRLLEKDYGDFSPAQNGTNGAEVRNLSGGKSRYDESAPNSDSKRDFEAQRAQGARFFHLFTTTNQSGCSLELWFGDGVDG